MRLRPRSRHTVLVEPVTAPVPVPVAGTGTGTGTGTTGTWPGLVRVGRLLLQGERVEMRECAEIITEITPMLSCQGCMPRPRRTRRVCGGLQLEMLLRHLAGEVGLCEKSACHAYRRFFTESAGALARHRMFHRVLRVGESIIQRERRTRGARRSWQDEEPDLTAHEPPGVRNARRPRGDRIRGAPPHSPQPALEDILEWRPITAPRPPVSE